MGRVDANPAPQSSDQTPFQHPSPPPQGYPNNHENPLSSSPLPSQPDAYMADNDRNQSHPQSTRSFVPQSPESMPPPEAFPPQKPHTYPPQQSPSAYPHQPEGVSMPPPEAYPPQKPHTYPPQQPPAAYPPQPEAVQFPPQPQPVQFPPQQTSTQQAYSNNYAFNSNAQPQVVNYGVAPTGYQTPVKNGPPQGIAVGTQYLAPTQEWSNGLFDCAEDPENAIITACFPCITFGQIAEIVDHGQTSCATSGLIYGLISAFIGIPCIMSCSYRTKIRSRYGLLETPAPDWATHFFCEWCALCQEYRQLKAQGLDPAIGWQGNMAKNQQMQQYQVMTPPMNQTMMS
ncbi:unnamed protein product [Lactuca virosa]|uniref:Uncharacterized protein n=1 Tax=Lactuca virosa TaxID=75947 RepID=A0AAU9M9C6_9ASTR|nr:unnamed protein product [Lactuca virosa]